MDAYSTPIGMPSFQVMLYHPIHDIWFYLLAAAVLLSLAVHTWRYRQASAARYLTLSLVTRVAWLGALIMITVIPALADKRLWAVIHQVSALITIPLTLMTAVHLTGQRPAVIRAARVFFIVFTGFFCLAVLTSGWHDWYWRGLPGDGSAFGFVRGTLHWTAMAVAYLIFAVTLALYLSQAARTSGLRRWQALAVPIDMLISVAGHARWLTSPQDPIPVLPLAFMLGSLFWFAIFFGLRVFNLQELAESTVTRDMNDCLIVTDAQDYIVELNPAARQLFGERAAVMADRRVETAFAPWPGLAELAAGREARTGEIPLDGDYYLFRVTPLAGWGYRNIGKAIVLRDISDQKRAQARIIEQQKALSIMAERDRLGRELHDGQGQIWNFLNLKLQTIQLFLAEDQPEKARLEVQQLISTVKELNTDARESIIGLKLAADTGDDFVAKLKDYLAWYKECTGIDVQLSLPLDQSENLINHYREVQILRIIQEALTNIRKHAGARHVKVGIAETGKRTMVRIEDDGCGFNMPASSAAKITFGLQIMAERAAEAGGQLEIDSKPGEGTKVVVRFDRESSESKVLSDEDIVG